MNCAWNELLAILPPRIRPEVDRHGRDSAEELRLRVNAPPELRCGRNSLWLKDRITGEDIRCCVNTASRFSPWASAGTASGYVTAPGGHRIGLCGEAVMIEGRVTGVRNIQGLCIRIARDFPGIAQPLAGLKGSVLILGAPGWGKTTLLRDLIRRRSDREVHVGVVDQRGELFPGDFPRGTCTDVLTGCPKAAGIDMLLRTMGPETIALDEITAREDCEALIQAAWCGVDLIATVHASCLEDLQRRELYRSLMREGIFDHLVILNRDKSWHVERSRA